MVPTVSALLRRRLASLALVALLGAAIAAPGAATASGSADGVDLTTYETAMVAALNADRTSRGLVAVRVDPRLMAIARARSDDMVAKDYFSHTQPDGRNVFAILTAQHITWYNAGEIIATNNYAMEYTVSVANRQWMASPGHKAIIVSTNYNYVGVGLAIDPTSGNKLWTAVFLKGPDRTAARVTVYTPSMSAGPTASTRRVRLSWAGYDVRLQVLTSGLRGYAIQRRIDGGSWTTAMSTTTLRSVSFTVGVGHRTEFRVLARDHAGNLGAWITKVIDLT